MNKIDLAVLLFHAFVNVIAERDVRTGHRSPYEAERWVKNCVETFRKNMEKDI